MVGCSFANQAPQFFSADAENDITLTALRLLTSDLLALFHAMNEGMINVLGSYIYISLHPTPELMCIFRALL